ncbi:tRNA (guanine-N2-)-methyltransferase [Talaromyces islandicus]|uniref:tRNA (guanine(26)-N(2))-dimethyltransferase n=1 Tax=Talaromyces islandicus TaxID=28573 RepID=A0A0U1LZK6_TALIS|nr:tRNA (guanine-N2-)-methyltransferase [Talaromyces islandicus]
MARLLPVARGSYLPYWILFMSLLAFYNTYACYTISVTTDKGAHPNIAYPLTDQLTPLTARFYGTWTAATGTMRFVTAYRVQEKGLYTATLISFVITCLNFLSEVVVFETATWGSLGQSAVQKLTTVPLSAVKQPPHLAFNAARTMATEETPTAPPPPPPPSSATPTSTVTIDGKEYESVKEGLAYILKPVEKTARPEKPRGSGTEQQASVFYNPIQQFNRDLTVIAINVFANHSLASKKATAARAQRRAKGRKGKKRKREDDGEGEGDSARNKPNTTDEGQDGEEVSLAENQEKQNEPPKPEAPPMRFQILDALSATGLRALRYAKEIPLATTIVSNDLSPSAVEAVKVNIKYNNVEEIVRPNVGDARVYMYGIQGEKKSHIVGKFDVIDLDPYGTAGPFLDAAVQAINDGGLLCVTCTDAGVFASTGYPEKAYSLYGGIPTRLPHGHEVGLRLIVNAIATAAAKYGLAVEPLLSLSIDYYARVFVRVHKSPAEVKFLSGKTMLLYNCDSGCGAWTTQYMTRTLSRANKAGQYFFHHGLTQAPTSSEFCRHCGFKTHLAGPMWGGPLHNAHFIQKVLDMLPELDPETYPTTDRIEGMLTTAMEEDLDLIQPQTSATEPPKVEQQEKQQQQEKEDITPSETDKPPQSAIIPRLDPQLKEKYPFFVSLGDLSRVIRSYTIPINMFRGALHGLGYRTTRSHTRPNSVRTDAPWDVIWEVMREWQRQRTGDKPHTLPAGTPGAGIMKHSQVTQYDQGEDKPLTELKRELSEALASGTDVRDLTTKIEAALYRKGASSTTTTTQPISKPKNPNDESNGDENTNGATSGNTEEPAHLHTRKIVFDESLVPQPTLTNGGKKKVVRYQMNPEANWGPMSRASGR